MKKEVITTLIIYLAIVVCCTSCAFAPGSYPYAELYEFQLSEDSLIKVVERFKIQNPEYNIPNQERFVDGRKNEAKQWYHVWFYYPQDKKVVKCWIQATNNGYASIGFVGIGDGLSLDNYKELNKDFSDEENNLQKEKFERLILNKIKKSME